MVDIGQCLSSRPGLRPLLAGAAFFLVLCLALFMRLYRIGEETPHPDEITTLTGLYEETFAGSLEAARILDPPMTPLYFLAQYAWGRTVGLTVLRMRLLSLVFSMAAFLAVYRLGVRLNGTRAGLAAMALLAVSPIHVYYSVEIRNYALTVLLAALSLLTLLRGVEHPGRRAWALNFAVDLLLAMSHLFASLLFVAQAVFLLLHHRRRPVLVPWMLSHMAVSLAVAVWLATCDFQAIRNASGYLKPLGWENVRDLFAALAGAPYYQFVLVLGGWSIGLVVIGVFLLAMMALGLDRLLLRNRTAGTVEDGRHRDQSRALSLVALAFLVPPLLLAAVTLCFTPCFIPRYVLASALAATLLLACAVTMPRARIVRALLAAALVALNFYQSAVLLDRRPQRDGWTEICRFLQDHVKQEDYFVVLPPYASRFITGIEMLAPAKPKRTLHWERWSEAELEELAAWHARGVRVWLMNHLNEEINAELETALTRRGLPFTKEAFPYSGFALHCVPADGTEQRAAEP